MKLRRLLIGLVPCLSLTLTSLAATTNTMDWQFSSAGNPSPITSQNLPNGGTPLATFSGNNNTYFFNTAPGGANGYFGPPTGLWDVNGGQLTLTISDRAASAPVDYTLTIVQFVDNALYPGTVSFTLPGAVNEGRVVTIPQTGNMGGFWVADTYGWSGVDLSANAVSLGISPATSGTALLLDEVQFTIVGTLTQVPEPAVVQLLAAGLLGFGIHFWIRRKKNA